MERSLLWVLGPPVLHNDPPAWDHPISQDSPNQHVIILVYRTRRWVRRLDKAADPWHLLALGTGEVSGALWQSRALLSTRSHCPLHGLYFICSTMEDIDGFLFQLSKPKPKERTGLWGESCSWRGEQHFGLQVVFRSPMRVYQVHLPLHWLLRRWGSSGTIPPESDGQCDSTWPCPILLRLVG